MTADAPTARVATEADAVAIAEMHATLFSPPWCAADVAALLAHPGSVSFVAAAADGTGARAFIIGRVAADEAELLSLGVRQDARRQGLGRRLVKLLAAESARRGACRLYLEVSAENAIAIALYRQEGFTEVGRRRAYYRAPDRPPEDAIVLARNLALPPVD